MILFLQNSSQVKFIQFLFKADGDDDVHLFGTIQKQAPA